MNRNLLLIAGCAIAGSLLAIRWYVATPSDPASVGDGDTASEASDVDAPPEARGAAGVDSSATSTGRSAAGADDAPARGTGGPEAATNRGDAADAGTTGLTIGGQTWPRTDAGTDAAFVPGIPPDPNAPDDPAARHAAFVDGVRVGFDDARTAFTTCYEDVLAGRPDAADRLVIEVEATVSPNDPEIASLVLQSIEAGDLVVDELDCFAEAVSKLIVPAPPAGPDGGDGATTIRYPLTLAPSGAP